MYKFDLTELSKQLDTAQIDEYTSSLILEFISILIDAYDNSNCLKMLNLAQICLDKISSYIDGDIYLFNKNEIDKRTVNACNEYTNAS